MSGWLQFIIIWLRGRRTSDELDLKCAHFDPDMAPLADLAASAAPPPRALQPIPLAHPSAQLDAI
ncbi:MAG: hypothetical protein NW223_11935 [Hyphomicrobiaceae bacterium]|nr:hypothetical protein [Hyphomicrobiaceae bacterium]